MNTPSRPRLIVVTGRPGAGKSTLAPLLARAIRCPAVSRDEIMEGLVNTCGREGRPADAAALVVYRVFFDTVALLLNNRVTVVAEAAFQHGRWAAGLGPLLAIADVRIVVCHVDAPTAFARRTRRGADDLFRHRFHADATVTDDPYEPPRLPVSTLEVDTSDGYRPALDAVVAFAGGSH